VQARRLGRSKVLLLLLHLLLSVVLLSVAAQTVGCCCCTYCCVRWPCSQWLLLGTSAATDVTTSGKLVVLILVYTARPALRIVWLNMP
jgi:hypothetical protein